MNEIRKLFVTDLDGTFLDADGSIPKNAASFLTLLKAHHFSVMFASARPFGDIRRIIPKNFQPDWIICCDGALTLHFKDGSFTIIHENNLEEELFLKNLHYFESQGELPVVFQGSEFDFRVLIPRIMDKSDVHAIASSDSSRPLVCYDSFRGLECLKNVRSLSLYGDICHDKFDRIKRLNNKLANVYYYKETRFDGKMWLDINSLHADKYLAASKITREEGYLGGVQVALGNGSNDLNLLSKSEWSAVPATAIPSAKASATHVSVAREGREFIKDIETILRRHHMSNVIGMITPDGTNPFFYTLSLDMQRQLANLEYSMIVLNSDNAIANELSSLRLLLEMNVAGVIFVSGGDHDKTYIELKKCGKSTVIMDREIPDTTNCDFVIGDNENGVISAVNYLVNQNHSRIAVLKGLQNTGPGRDRYKAFKEALRKEEMTHDPRLEFEGAFDYKSGVQAANKIAEMRPEERPTAVFSANDIMAFGLMQGLLAKNINVPEEISIIGYDDIQISSWVHPRLTTIRQETTRIAIETAYLITSRIKGYSGKPRHKLIEPRRRSQLMWA